MPQTLAGFMVPVVKFSVAYKKTWIKIGAMTNVVI